MIYETFREAVKNIWSNKFRTFLTMLGIIIGVGGHRHRGSGQRYDPEHQGQLAEMGTNVLTCPDHGPRLPHCDRQQMYEMVDSPGCHRHVAHHHVMDSTVKVGTTTYGYTHRQGCREATWI